MALGNLGCGSERQDNMKRAVPLLTLLAIVATACGAAPATTQPPTTTLINEQLGSLAVAQDRWAAASPSDYTVTQIDHASDVEQPITLAVRDGEAVSLSGNATMVDEVFKEIDESIRNGAAVDVDYHPQLGYPMRVAIDRDGDGVFDVDLEYSELVAMPVVKTVEELRMAQRRWKAQNLDSYRYIFRFECTCPEGGTFEVDVRDGRVVARRPLDEAARNSSLDPGLDIESSFADLEEWFTDSAPLIEEGILAVEVRMDPRFGYPRWFRIEGEDLDGDFFPGPFTMVVTIDLVGELDPVEPTIDLDDLEQVEKAHALWQQAAVEAYQFVLQVHCMCPQARSGPFLVTVEEGEATSAVLLVDGSEAHTEILRVDDALEMIGLAVAAGTDVDVQYNAALGYPELVIIDPEAVAVDGGLAFSITEFEMLTVAP